MPWRWPVGTYWKTSWGYRLLLVASTQAYLDRRWWYAHIPPCGVGQAAPHATSAWDVRARRRTAQCQPDRLRRLSRARVQLSPDRYPGSRRVHPDDSSTRDPRTPVRTSGTLYDRAGCSPFPAAPQ